MSQEPTRTAEEAQEEQARDALARAIQAAILKRDPNAGSGCWLEVLHEIDAYGLACFRQGKAAPQGEKE